MAVPPRNQSIYILITPHVHTVYIQTHTTFFKNMFAGTLTLSFSSSKYITFDKLSSPDQLFAGIHIGRKKPCVCLYI